MEESIEQLILALEQKLQEATLHNDVETLAECLAENWLNANEKF